MPPPSETRSIAWILTAAAAAIMVFEVGRALLLPLPGWQAASLSVIVIAVVTAVAAQLASRRMRALAAAAAARRRAEEALRASERFTRALMEHSSDLITILNPDGVVRFASPSHEWIVGYAPGELIGRNAFDLVHPDDQPTLAEAFTQVIRTPGMTMSREFRFRHKDGSWRWVDAAARAALDDPIIAGAVINSRDVTELRAAQREEVEVAAALARLGRELIAQIDRGALLDRLCRLTTETLGCEVSRTYLLDLDGMRYTPVASYGDSPERWEAVRVVSLPRRAADRYVGALKDVDVAEIDLRMIPPSERAFSIGTGAPRMVAMALRRGGELVGVQTARFRHHPEPCAPTQVRIARGLAQLASLALENARLVDELDRADRVKSDFVASMSHELRTPLNVIIGYADLLADHIFGELSVDQEETIRRIGEQGRELLELVNTTLDLSRLESGRVALALQQVDLISLLAEIEVEAQLVRKNAAVGVSWEVAANLPSLCTDPLKLKVIVKNLLFNAIKFTDEGRVVVRAQARDGGVEIAVEDSGIGIPTELLSAIFDPFRQADGGGTPGRGGVGLGLHIVRRLLDMLGGSVEVESEVGRGSTFRIWVPSQRDAAAPEALNADL